ncbi:hypothetical protein L226DRAFT_574066 [Lentinus tigrinus ALCF2SS1-7]|uniref:uncharacterized protein n=1 Tax=Lentinus tigrinus ALCF2SS1-7 TaxID=1328758 RepID=UPI001165E08B|nr:hypothetical protein L226DRAFT_574066 [Lentinus tigrinus ALCF2SS1-7]
MSSVCPSLPLDVIHNIATLADHADLPPLLLTNRHINELLTPILYSIVDLGAWDNIAMCVRTLHTPPKHSIYGRNLAGLVRTFELRKPLTRLPYYISTCRLAKDLNESAGRMHQLRRFSSGIHLGPEPSEILYTFVSGSFPYLRAIKMHIGDITPDVLRGLNQSETGELVLVAPPSLHDLELELPAHLDSVHSALVRTLLRTSSRMLRSLSLKTSHHPTPELWSSVLPQQGTFPALETLEIHGNALAHPTIAQAEDVHSLKIIDYWDAQHVPPPNLFPNLRALSSPRELLSFFLPEEASEHHRPLETICIDNISPERSADGYPGRKTVPFWPELLPIFSHLPSSGVPVKSVSFGIECLTDTAMEFIRNNLRDLEHLAIYLPLKWRQDTVSPIP